MCAWIHLLIRNTTTITKVTAFRFRRASLSLLKRHKEEDLMEREKEEDHYRWVPEARKWWVLISCEWNHTTTSFNVVTCINDVEKKKKTMEMKICMWDRWTDRLPARSSRKTMNWVKTKRGEHPCNDFLIAVIVSSLLSKKRELLC